jgi:hypothetical protein
LSSIRKLTSAGAEEVLKKKYEQQIALAEALKSQIEDKAKRNAKAAAKIHLKFREQEQLRCIASIGSEDSVSALPVIYELSESREKALSKQLFTRADLSLSSNHRDFRSEVFLNLNRPFPIFRQQIASAIKGRRKGLTHIRAT